MNIYWYCIVSKIIGITGFVVMAINGYPWWGLLCFFALAGLEGEKNEDTRNKKP